jgi:hypothetical protein
MNKMFQRPQFAPWRLEMCDHRNTKSKINLLPQQWCNPQLKTMNRFIKKRRVIKGEHKMIMLWRKKHLKPPTTQVRATIQRNHPVDQILGDISKGVTTRSRLVNFCEHYSFVSSIEPFRVEEVLLDPDWVLAMQEELNKFQEK